MLLNKMFVSLWLAAALATVVDAGKGGAADYCAGFGLLTKHECPKNSDILTLPLPAQNDDFPTDVTVNSEMYIVVAPKKFGGTEACYDVTLFTLNPVGDIQVQLPTGLTCTDIQFTQGRWCHGNLCSTMQTGGGKRALRNRRLLDDAVIVASSSSSQNRLDDDPNQKTYETYAKQCADYDYDVSLYVDHQHLMAVAAPKPDGIAAGCPLAVTHYQYNSATDMHEKEVILWDKEKTRNQAHAYLHSDSYPVGTFRGSELVKAFEGIDITTVMHHKSFDIVSNNCANFMMALAKSLNVKIDAKMTAFVARRLLQSSSQDFVNRIRSSANFRSLFNGGRKLIRSTVGAVFSDEQVIELLVEKNAAAGV